MTAAVWQQQGAEALLGWGQQQVLGAAVGLGWRGWGSAEHAAPPVSPPALAAARGSEGGTAGLGEDVPDVLLEPG